MQPLKLAALDPKDLEVLSAHLQDAVLRVADMAYVPSQRRFAAIANRFDWESALAGEAKGTAAQFERRRSALRFDRVMRAQFAKIRMSAKGAVLNLLAIQFEPTAGPGGYITLQFAGGGAIRLEVECIEAALKDMGPVWRTKTRPDHDDAEPEASQT